MKNLFSLFIIVVLFIFSGCWPESSVAPDYSANSDNQFLKLTNNSSSLSIESIISDSKIIDGNKGGKLKLKDKTGDIEIKAELDIPKNAFEGSVLISAFVDNQSTSIDLFPTPFAFNKSLELTLEYDGVDLSGYSEDEIDFYYLSAEGNLVKAEYDELKVNVSKGELKVKNAKIPHFSRYGFTKRSAE